MEKYDYLEALVSDIMDWYDEEKDYCPKWESRDEAEEWLNDHLWASDQITGNGSGSYWFSTWKAEEALCHNLDLLQEAVENFGGGEMEYQRTLASPEGADVTIRCYLLGQAIAEFLDKYEADGTIKYGEEEEDADAEE